MSGSQPGIWLWFWNGCPWPPHKSTDSVAEEFLTFKMCFLLDITSLKRVGDLQVLSVSLSCLEFAPGRVKAILHPRLGYVPKVPNNVAQSTVLLAFHPPPHVSGDQEKMHLFFLVKACDLWNLCA